MRKKLQAFPNGFRFCLSRSICMVFLLSGFLLFIGKANSAEVTLAWGKIVASDLKGYKIYYGASSKSYDYCVNVVNATSCVISGLTPGKPYYFAATAYSTGGVESPYSNQIQYTPAVAAEPGSGSEIFYPNDFKYADSAFGDTRNGLYASGSIEGEALKVTLGGVDINNIIDGISGGWSGAFDVESNGYATISFMYRLITSRYDIDECNQVWVAVDGNLTGCNGEDYVDQICGIGDSGWQQVALEVYLSGGSHRLTVGGFNNKKTGLNEYGEIFFEGIEIKQQP
ncbi:fibronectin type III domain-containing protein [Desulfococcus sp.]|uniref:fibronectin type III domain-containing protein n=1 Tax=Desulfococcus sp. TaxID=2025834 RepID=UPI0035935DE8